MIVSIEEKFFTFHQSGQFMENSKEHASIQFHYQSIGQIHSPFNDVEGMPIQPSGARGVRGSVVVYPKYTQGLKDLDGFSHVILLYHFHETEGSELIVTPFMDSRAHGVFATRAPRRPNPIGLSVVRLLEISKNILKVENVDVLDATPLIDIKPYVPAFDHHPADRIGWLEANSHLVKNKVSDKRFKKPVDNETK
jgi:tRNA-Thr(GGU) m(6)t(6)A37 methyltransferase TsaA